MIQFNTYKRTFWKQVLAAVIKVLLLLIANATKKDFRKVSELLKFVFISDGFRNCASFLRYYTVVFGFESC